MKQFKAKKKPKDRLKSSIAENAGVSLEELKKKLALEKEDNHHSN